MAYHPEEVGSHDPTVLESMRDVHDAHDVILNESYQWVFDDLAPGFIVGIIFWSAVVVAFDIGKRIGSAQQTAAA